MLRENNKLLREQLQQSEATSERLEKILSKLVQEALTSSAELADNNIVLKAMYTQLQETGNIDWKSLIVDKGLDAILDAVPILMTIPH